MPCSNSICAASNLPIIIRSRPRILCASAFFTSSWRDFRQRLNRLPDLLLCELAVTQCIPAPRGLRALLDVPGKQRLDLFELAFAECSLRTRTAARGRPRPRPAFRQPLRDSVWRKHRPGLSSNGLLVRRGCALGIALLFEHVPKVTAALRKTRDSDLIACRNLAAACSSSPLSSATRPSAMSRLAFWLRSSAAASSRPFLSFGRRLHLFVPARASASPS